MARLWQSGFELNSATSGVECSTVSGAGVSIDGTTVRTGSRSLKVTSSNGTRQGIVQQFASSASNGPYYLRFYLYIATAPSANNGIAVFSNGNLINSGVEVYLYLTSSRTLILNYNNAGSLTTIGSASSAIPLNTWTEVELKIDLSGGSSHHVVEARLAETIFATASNLTVQAGAEAIRLGTNLAGNTDTTGVLYFDDVAINDSTGTAQTGYAGAGSIIHMQPAGAGETTQLTKSGSSPAATNWQGVSEVTPDDGVTYNSTASAINTDDIYTLGASGIPGGNTPTLVAVGVRYRMGAVSSGLHLKLETQSGGTKQDSGSLNNSAQGAFATNSQAATKNYPLVAYVDPQASGAWTTVLVDACRIDVHNSGGANTIDVSTVWLSVEYAPTPSGNNYSQTLTETITDTDTLVKQTSRSLSEVLTNTSTLLKLASRTLIESITDSDTLVTLRTAFGNFTEAITHTDTLLKMAGKNLSESVSHSDTFSRVWNDFRTFTETITHTDTLVKLTTRVFSEATSLVATLVKTTTRTLSEAISFVGSLIKTTTRTLTEMITDTDAFDGLRAKFATYSEAITHTDSFLRSIQRTFTETISHTDTLLKTMSRVMTETITHTSALIKTTSKTFSETITHIETFLKTITKNLTEVITHTDTIAAFKIHLLSATETITHTDTVTNLKVLIRTFTETISTSDLLFWKYIRAAISFTKHIASVVTFTKHSSTDPSATKHTSQTTTFTKETHTDPTFTKKRMS